MTLTDVTISYSLVFSGLTPLDVNATDVAPYTLQQLGSITGAFDSTVSFEMTNSHIFGHQDIGTESLTIAFEGDPSTPWGLWYKRTSDSPWENIVGAVASAGNNGGVVMTYTHDGGLMGSLNGGTYAIFDVASEEVGGGSGGGGNYPPATGVYGLTATIHPDAQMKFNWGYEDDSLLGGADFVAVYTCTGVGCTVDMSTPVFTTSPTLMAWTLVGNDGESYTVLVQTENGQYDGSGNALTGGGQSITVIADGGVTPAPTIEANSPIIEDTGITFTWTATSTDDVEHWMVCWSGSQSVVQDSFDSVVGDGACAETTDSTTSLTVTEQDICDGECNTNMFFAIGAKDATGNVYSPSAGTSHLSAIDFSDGVVDPGVIDGGSDSDEDNVGEDSDGDGVTDGNDICPQTPIGESVNSYGCSHSQIDFDEDGWNDTVDACPLLWGNSTVLNGCPDADEDQVSDPEDDCPNTFGTSTQPTVGCPDDDSDGWANANDSFPFDANEWNDADGDNIGDNADQCPNTPLDISVGRDGCELSEESSLLFYSAVGAGGIAGASLLFFMMPRMMRGMNAEEQKDRMKWDDQVWQEPKGMPMGPPVEAASQPEPSLTGVSRPDGYEYLEWPAASGDWWYRSGAGLDWAKWEQ